MAELESVIEKRLMDQLYCDESQWTYRPDIKTEEQLWNNFKYILEQNNKAKLNDVSLSDSEFAKIKNDLSHASFYDAGKWLEVQIMLPIKEANENALPKFKFRKQMIDEFKNVLMPKIVLLID
ncbi:MAG: hypothetical protein NC240_01355 [Clostridium sp.]|nr:hypothetical protein [Clostridium sp.]